jgi:uncharacterized membrane protein (UPF0127 family)
MRWRRLFLFTLLGCLCVTACNRRGVGSQGLDPDKSGSAAGGSSEGHSAENRSSAMPTNLLLYSDRALPKLPSLKLWVGKQVIEAEMAVTARELATGMMYRTNILENEGMLFRLPFPQRASFYMRNTEVPLSCAYIDAEGTILEIHDLQPLNEKPVPSATENILYVLETAQGWFERNSIGVGTVIRTADGSLAEVFSRNRRRL